MKQKTREFCKSVENACRIARDVPFSWAVNCPEGDLCKALDAARDRFFERLTDKLPRYQIPETASLFARGLHWPDVEDAHILPDGRLLVRWEDFTMPEVLTEAEYLSTIAHRSEWIGDFADDPDSLYNHILASRRKS